MGDRRKEPIKGVQDRKTGLKADSVTHLLVAMKLKGGLMAVPGGYVRYSIGA